MLSLSRLLPRQDFCLSMALQGLLPRPVTVWACVPAPLRAQATGSPACALIYSHLPETLQVPAFEHRLVTKICSLQ